MDWEVCEEARGLDWVDGVGATVGVGAAAAVGAGAAFAVTGSGEGANVVVFVGALGKKNPKKEVFGLVAVWVVVVVFEKVVGG